MGWFFILTGVECLFLQHTVNAHNFNRQPGSCSRTEFASTLWHCTFWIQDAQTSNTRMDHKENIRGGYKLLGGGFKYFLFLSLLGEIIQFDEHIFQMGWNHQLEQHVKILWLTYFFFLWLKTHCHCFEKSILESILKGDQTCILVNSGSTHRNASARSVGITGYPKSWGQHRLNEVQKSELDTWDLFSRWNFFPKRHRVGVEPKIGGFYHQNGWWK